jgi:hypothetical protein
MRYKAGYILVYLQWKENIITILNISTITDFHNTMEKIEKN